MGKKMPEWVIDAYKEYHKRIPAEYTINLVELPLTKRKNASIDKIMDKEGALMRKQIKSGNKIIALTIDGTVLSSEKLATKLLHFQQNATNLSLMIGGPEGLNSCCTNIADEKWSLSALTLPHPIVRIVLIEALYRAWSINNNHPYHK